MGHHVDYKDRIQECAMQMAEDIEGVDFYDLPPEKRYEIYSKAEEKCYDLLVSQADI